MEMPDIEVLCHAFINSSTGERYGILNAIYGSVNNSDIGNTTDIPSPHLWGWYPAMMKDHLQWAGFENINFSNEQFPHPGNNFRVEATKPTSLSTIFPGINVDYLKRQDPLTFAEIFEDNSYNVSKKDIEGCKVLDIGANIGLFTSLCVSYGATEIVSAEASPEVFVGLLHNVEKFKQVVPLNFAVYKNSNEIVKIYNQNVASRISEEGSEVQTITLQDLLGFFSADDNDMFLKIDCEGSEYPIILTADKKDIRKFKTVVMEVHWELHEDPMYRGRNTIIDKMESFGFELVYTNRMVGGEEKIPMTVEIERWERI